MNKFFAVLGTAVLEAIINQIAPHLAAFCDLDHLHLILQGGQRLLDLLK